MPRRWLYVQLADRWHGDPDYYRKKPADELFPLLSMLAVEAEVAADWEGLGPDDDVVRYDGEDE